MNSQESLDIRVASAGCAAIALHRLALGFGLDAAAVFQAMAVVALALSAGFALGSLPRPRGD